MTHNTPLARGGKFEFNACATAVNLLPEAEAGFFKNRHPHCRIMLGSPRSADSCSVRCHNYSASYWSPLLILAACLASSVVVGQSATPLPRTADRPKLLSKEVLIRHDKGRPVATGFITYISKNQPVLMHCFGRSDYSDGYDDYAIQVSTDNGRTWIA